MNRAFKKAFLIGTAATAILLSGCATDRYAYGGAEVAYGNPLYYDGFYGPYWDGYWGPDGFYYFWDASGHHYRRDDGHHFRHDTASGYHWTVPNRTAGGVSSPIPRAIPGRDRNGTAGGSFGSHGFPEAGRGGGMGGRRG